jgi:hypothetical protein
MAQPSGKLVKNLDVLDTVDLVPLPFRNVPTELVNVVANGATVGNVYTGNETDLGIPGGLAHTMAGAADHQEASSKITVMGDRFVLVLRAEATLPTDVDIFVNGRHTNSFNTQTRMLGISQSVFGQRLNRWIARGLPHDGPHTIEIATRGDATSSTSAKAFMQAILAPRRMGYQPPARISSVGAYAVMPTTQTAIPRASLSGIVGVMYTNKHATTPQTITPQFGGQNWGTPIVLAAQTSYFFAFAGGESIAMDASSFTHAADANPSGVILYSVVGRS